MTAFVVGDALLLVGMDDPLLLLQPGSDALDGSRKVMWATVNYRFSRRTDIYAVVDRNEVEGGYARPAFLGTLGSQTAVSVGLRHRF